MEKLQLIDYLNSYLNIHHDRWDSSQNWIQVDTTKKSINKIWYAVDATTYIIEKAIQENVDIILVHHWIFWWKEDVLLWVQYERIKKLIEWNIWLYACHLPLDAHKEIWNNAMTLKKICWFLWIEDFQIWNYFSINGNNIWWKIDFWKEIALDNIISALKHIWWNTQVYNFWNKEKIKSIWIVTWCWWSILKKIDLIWDIDLFLTGEALHDSITYAKERSQSFILWGHYESEIIWVQSLSENLKKQYWLDIVFLNEKY